MIKELAGLRSFSNRAARIVFLGSVAGLLVADLAGCGRKSGLDAPPVSSAPPPPLPQGAAPEGAVPALLPEQPAPRPSTFLDWLLN
jgi:hypothetical protein